MAKRTHPAHRMSQYGPEEKPQMEKSDETQKEREATERTRRWLKELDIGD